MQLRDWVLADHASVLGRFDQSITPHVPTERWKDAADGGGSSIAALLLHLSRHQDLAITTVIGGRPPIVEEHRVALGLDDTPLTAALSEAEDRDLTARVHVDALVTYARAVHDATQHWLRAVDELETVLDDVPDTSARLSAVGVTRDAVPWLFAMWSDKPVSWLVMWPGIGHGHTHVGEATSIRNRLGLSPF